MADAEFKLEGIEELVTKGDKLALQFGPIVRECLAKSVMEIERKAKRIAPVDTGRLRSSITNEVGPGAMPTYAEVGTNVNYARFVEFGTPAHWPPPGALAGWAGRHGIPEFMAQRAIGNHGTKPKPFLIPAFEQSKAAIEQNIQEAIQKIEGTWEG